MDNCAGSPGAATSSSTATVSRSGCAALQLDITKRKQAEEQFRLVVEAAPNAMIMANTEGRALRWSTRRHETVFGYTCEELIGHPIGDACSRAIQVSSHRTIVTVTLATRGLGRIGAGRELLGRRKDGSESSRSKSVSTQFDV